MDVGGAPLSLRPQPADLETIVLGPSRQVALLRTRPAADALRDHPRFESIEIFHLVGRVRLDGRSDLEARLADRVRIDLANATDARLCLAAYVAWGERCLDHLAGDFSFAIWNERDRRLFSACDQLGKRSLFHGRRGALVAVGSSIDFVAEICAPDRDLDDCWIADFLSLNFSREFERTAYRDVRRLGPGRAIAWQQDREAPEIRRYWQLDIAEPLFLPRKADYLERFRDLTMRSIADRMPRGPVGIALSGGLDSGALAACAVRVASDPRRVVAYCEHYERMMDIREDTFAGMTAQRLGIDLKIEPYDDLVYDPQWQSRGWRPAEPLELVLNAEPLRRLNDRLAARATTWLEGEGPDNALELDRDPYLGWLRGRGAWGRLAATLFDYARVKGVAGWLQTLKRHGGFDEAAEGYDFHPPWIGADLARRVRLEERIRDLNFGGTAGHPWHPNAVGSFTSPIWQDYFREYDFQEGLSHLQWLHPFLDLRVLEFLLRVPPVPWAWKKDLIRKSMRGWLPEPVLRRPKTALPIAPRGLALKHHGLPTLLAPERLAAYVDIERLPGSDEPIGPVNKSGSAYALDHWLATMPHAGRPGRD